MSITPEQIKALITMLLPLMDQLVQQKGGMFIKTVWPFIRSFIATTDAQAFAAAQAALPAESKVV